MFFFIVKNGHLKSNFWLKLPIKPIKSVNFEKPRPEMDFPCKFAIETYIIWVYL